MDTYDILDVLAQSLRNAGLNAHVEHMCLRVSEARFPITHHRRTRFSIAYRTFSITRGGNFDVADVVGTLLAALPEALERGRRIAAAKSAAEALAAAMPHCEEAFVEAHRARFRCMGNPIYVGTAEDGSILVTVKLKSLESALVAADMLDEVRDD